MPAHRCQRRGTSHRHPVHHRGFGDIRLWQDQLVTTHGARRERDRQGASNRPQITLQPKLAKKERPGDAIVGDLPAGRKNADGNREVERTAPLLDVSRREIHGYPAKRELVAGIAERRRNPLAAFLHRAKRETDSRERWKSVGNVDLDVDGERLDAEHGGGSDAGEQSHLDAELAGIMVSPTCVDGTLQRAPLPGDARES